MCVCVCVCVCLMCHVATYTVSQKSSTPNSTAITLSFLNGFPKILSLLQREVYYQQNPYNTSQHTFSILPRYLATVRSSSFGIFAEKCKRKYNMH